jgi:hypothetical protein
VEDNPHDEPTEQQSTNLNDNDEPTYSEENDGHDYDDHTEAGVENAAANGEHQGFIVEEFDTGISHDNHGHGFPLDEFDVHQEYEEDGAATYSRIEFGTDGEGYIDENTYTDQGDEFDLEYNEPLPQISLGATREGFRETEGSSPTNEEGGTHNPPRATNVTASSLGSGDAAESSATASGDEIQYENEEAEKNELDEEVFDDSKTTEGSYSSNEAPRIADAAQKDEIDYEDDEDEDDDETSQQSTGAQAIPSANKELSPTNGKRSRADLESDDGTSMRGKGVYGPPNKKRRMI